jgi:hypothetical protein
MRPGESSCISVPSPWAVHKLSKISEIVTFVVQEWPKTIQKPCDCISRQPSSETPTRLIVWVFATEMAMVWRKTMLGPDPCMRRLWHSAINWLKEIWPVSANKLCSYCGMQVLLKVGAAVLLEICVICINNELLSCWQGQVASCYTSKN